MTVYALGVIKKKKKKKISKLSRLPFPFKGPMELTVWYGSFLFLKKLFSFEDEYGC